MRPEPGQAARAALTGANAPGSGGAVSKSKTLGGRNPPRVLPSVRHGYLQQPSPQLLLALLRAVFVVAACVSQQPATLHQKKHSSQQPPPAQQSHRGQQPSCEALSFSAQHVFAGALTCAALT